MFGGCKYLCVCVCVCVCTRVIKTCAFPKVHLYLHCMCESTCICVIAAVALFFSHSSSVMPSSVVPHFLCLQLRLTVPPGM